MVNPHDYTREDLKTCPWFWKKDQKGSDTMVDEIQNGHSPTEDDAWADLIRYKRGVKEGTMDVFKHREEAKARSEAARRAKGFTAMADAKAKEPVKEGAMSLEDAQKIVGRTNSTEPYLSNMIRALSSMSALNSAEENERLQAAKIVRAAKRKGK